MATSLILAGFLPLTIPLSEFSPGRHNVRVLRSTQEVVGGASLTVERMLVYMA